MSIGSLVRATVLLGRQVIDSNPANKSRLQSQTEIGMCGFCAPALLLHG